jgi:hypothetical protein
MNDSESGTEPSIRARQEKLLATARRYVDENHSEPGVVGMVLYGSLASGDPPELTQFSDVDVALILDHPLPAYFTEHRLLNEIKVDVLLFHIDTVRGLVAPQPERLYQGGWVPHFLIKSFLLGMPETVLFDPTGEIARIRQQFRELTTYEKMALLDAERWTEEIEKEYVAPAREQLREGHQEEALKRAGWTLGALEGTLLTLSATKKLALAAQRLGIPQFVPMAAELHQILTPPLVSVEAYWQAGHSLWDYTFRHLFEPIRAELRRAGVAEPDRLELTGDYNLFWGGNRIHEFGRVIAEVDLSFTWSRCELDRGEVSRALDMLWACDAENTRRRCKGLGTALDAVGHDVSHLVEPFLTDVAFEQLAAAADQAFAAIQRQSRTPAEAEQAVALARELHRIVSDMLDERTTGSTLDERR